MITLTILEYKSFKLFLMLNNTLVCFYKKFSIISSGIFVHAYFMSESV